ncbi:uncharacterized protein IL334_007552 [Kwoniella shivajii]|uniref:Uncharacterized protein n=1 Tax=Kwoniella shivajii TaxID=564305 RepID=A0ABZ1D8Z4_9TREE|nr:hypothetical protein IL334_007552 [Kwoniella shivajii]
MSYQTPRSTVTVPAIRDNSLYEADTAHQQGSIGHGLNATSWPNILDCGLLHQSQAAGGYTAPQWYQTNPADGQSAMPFTAAESNFTDSQSPFWWTDLRGEPLTQSPTGASMMTEGGERENAWSDNGDFPADPQGQLAQANVNATPNALFDPNYGTSDYGGDTEVLETLFATPKRKTSSAESQVYQISEREPLSSRCH